MLSEMAPVVSVIASRVTWRDARMTGLPPWPDGLPSEPYASSRRSTRPFSAPVTSMTASSIASSSSSRFFIVISFSLNSWSLRTPASCAALASPVPVSLIAARGGASGRAIGVVPDATGLRLVEDAELQLGVAERDAIAVDEAGAALLLAVDQDLAGLVDLLEIEVTAVEEDLRVGVGDPAGHRRRRRCRAPSDRGHGLVEHEGARRALGREPLEDRHWRTRRSRRPGAREPEDTATAEKRRADYRVVRTRAARVE